MISKKTNTALKDITLNEGWKRQLQDILKKNSGTRVNGKVASNRTQDIACKTLFSEFNTLRVLGYRTMPINFGNKQMEVLVKNWHDTRKLSPKTMATHLTQFRKFAEWIGKKGMVRDLAHYLPEVDPKTLQVHFAATESKSWSEHDIDVIEEITRGDAMDLRFGCMLRLEYAFGYRMQECLLCDPWVTDNIHSIAILPSQGKGNRARNIPMDSPAQRKIIEYIKTIIKKGEKVGWCDVDGTPYDLKVNINRYGYLMRKLGMTKKDRGVTGHGLRAEYSEDQALRLGYIPPTLGGTNDQMSKEDLTIKQKQVSERLGHSRSSVTAAYYGSSELAKENTKRRDEAKNKNKVIDAVSR